MFEWNETVFGGFSRGFRGGSFNDGDTDLRSSNGFNIIPIAESGIIGFRVACPVGAIPTANPWGIVVMVFLLAGAGTVVFKQLAVS